MTLKSMYDQPVGVVGAGNFGTVIANLLAVNCQVWLYARNEADVERMARERSNRGYQLHERVKPVNDLGLLSKTCDVIFPVVPSAHFRKMMKKLSPYLEPRHILIHGTKGFDITIPEGKDVASMPSLDRSQVKTMSEVIRSESVVLRIGCLAGPNLSKELAQQQPGATVIASSYKEVIQIGKRLLRNDRFQVYENDDIIGIEMAGVLKNIIAIAAGALYGLGYGDNAKGLLVSRGAVEMVYLGKALGGQPKAFLGVAGIGDLVTTCNSHLSRNFTVGYRLAKGETLQQIVGDMNEVAEGINTVQIAKKFTDYYNVVAPITDRLYRVLFENMKVEEALDSLMRFPFNADINFIE